MFKIKYVFLLIPDDATGNKDHSTHQLLTVGIFRK